jgi:hypothetical protein
MFEEFKEKKYTEYLNLVRFPEGRVSVHSLNNTKLPPYIVNFFECQYPRSNQSLTKAEFEKTLHKAIIFSINYIIKPKATIIKFIFGTVETRPAEYIKQKLNYFQFYNYYISHIEDFIELNNPQTISKNQVEHLINEINSKIFQEINNPVNSDTQKLNLIKLLYYFFLDLTDNNPINIKLPKKILSVFFQDKGYPEIKQKIDKFFSDEIFIQEAIELIKPFKVKAREKEETEELDEDSLQKFIDSAKSSLLSSDVHDIDISHALNITLKTDDVAGPVEDKSSGRLPEKTTLPIIKDITELKAEPAVDVKLPGTEIVLDEKIYSEDLKFQSQLQDAIRPEPPTQEEAKLNRLNEIFCEETYRKKIIKRIFNKDGKKFISSVLTILDYPTWKEASVCIGDLFDKNNIKYFSEEAVKFVDLIENHFIEINGPVNKAQGNE